RSGPGGRRQALPGRRRQQGRQGDARRLADLARARLRALPWSQAGRAGRAFAARVPASAVEAGVQGDAHERAPGEGHAELRRQQDGDRKPRRPLCLPEGTLRRGHSTRASRRAEMKRTRRLLLAAVLLPPSAGAADWPGYEKLTREQVVAALERASPSAPADFYAKNLSGLDLSRLDFKGANLGAAVLNRSDLTSANLSRCNLTVSFAEGANLTGARLIGDLRRVNLEQAVLTGADGAADMKNQSMGLMRANIVSAKLR